MENVNPGNQRILYPLESKNSNASVESAEAELPLDGRQRCREKESSIVDIDGTFLWRKIHDHGYL